MVLESERSRALARTLNIIYVSQGKVRGKAIDTMTAMPLQDRVQVGDDENVIFTHTPNPSAGHKARHEALQGVLRREELTPDIVKEALSSWKQKPSS